MAEGAGGERDEEDAALYAGHGRHLLPTGHGTERSVYGHTAGISGERAATEPIWEMDTDPDSRDHQRRRDYSLESWRSW